ncbi:hypothetical protein B0H16DRAFT_1414014 [Mycena metata]|uniref:Uncharacterized protein n=1 Tax=Mycena metata TaxID=1033252 RepID=A0AAD7JGQ6_9AGAR|nr:hypothetical protein B0H16DRAFT_1414014 [Mycena metata]
MAHFFLKAISSLLFAGFCLSSATSDVSAAPDVTSALSFSSSKWIWNSATATANAVVGFRKDFTPPLGKSLIAAEIIITAVSSLDLYVNGDFIGSGTPPHRGRFAHRFCVDLLPSLNVFAVNASTTGSGTGTDAGLIATILVTYQDNTTDKLLTDSSWRAKGALPLGWETLAFDDTAWPVATVVGSYDVAPWNTVLVNIPADPPVLTFVETDWVWTDVVPASGTLPAGSRAFRRTFTPAPNQFPASATILISADNEYTLYVNGVTIGSGSNFKVAQRYTVNFATAPSEVVLAVLVTNTAASTAGLLVAMEVNMVPSGRTSCTAGAFMLTDTLWKSTKGPIPDGFEQPGFDDSAWPAVAAEAVYPAAPWGTVTIATVAPVTI